MIDNNIIQSLGAGSGIDTANLTKQLTEIERAAPQQRIDSKRDKAETQISDFGLLSNAMATLQDAAKVLSEPEGLFSKSASYTDSDSLVPVELETNVQPGTYTFEVNAIAKSQSLASASFNSVDDAVGEGTLTFNIGKVTADASGVMTAFDQDTAAESVDIVIDSTNNSLEGLRDAINKADFGVQASIIYDGSGYVLQLTADSGANNALEITVDEGGTAAENIDNSGLSRFAFNVDASNVTQKQGGQDAELVVNGLTVTRESNVLDDVVDGLKFEILKPSDVGEQISITVSDDKAFAEQNIRDFVDSYNSFLDAIKPAVGISEVENEDGSKDKVVGSLSKDALAKSMLTQIRSVIVSAIPGLADSEFTTLGAMGIRTELNGSLSIDEKLFTRAFEENFESVQKLFGPHNATSDNGIYINSTNNKTTSGEYAVEITTPPTRGAYQGQTFDAAVDFTSPGFDASAKTYEFTVEVNGTSSATLTIPAAVYATEDDLAETIQSLINNDSAISAAGGGVTVSYDSTNNRFDIQSDKYGTSSLVSITSASTELSTDLGLTVAAGTSGQKVAGTINGVAGFGSTNVLLPALGQPGEGLALVVGEGVTSATVNFSRGFAGELETLLESFLGSKGLIASRESSLEKSLDKLDTDQETLDRRMSAYEERLVNQFIAMERILNSLNSSGSFLENLIDTLPFTATKN